MDRIASVKSEKRAERGHGRVWEGVGKCGVCGGQERDLEGSTLGATSEQSVEQAEAESPWWRFWPMNGVGCGNVLLEERGRRSRN